MLKILTLIIALSSTLSSAGANEINQAFGKWLVSCKQNLMTAQNDCFIGTPFEDEQGRGAIVITKYYMAVAHNEANLSQGVNFSVDKNKDVASFMNTGINVFFKNADRKILISQMSKGANLNIDITGITKLKKPLEGFKDAYNFYLKQIGS